MNGKLVTLVLVTVERWVEAKPYENGWILYYTYLTHAISP
jgi:hypothetical protein